MIGDDKRTKTAVILLIGAGVFLRFYFYFGHVFSDDAYYTYLAYTFYKGDFAADYLGYPICLVRVGQTWITALAFRLFGPGESSSVVFPMLFSIFNMFLSYRLTKIITNSEISALTVLLLTAFYPTEILFASIAFTDLFSTVFINSGILLLFIADRDRKMILSVIAGLLFFISVLFKINVFYTSILLSGLLCYQLLAKKSFNKYIFVSLCVLGAGMTVEGVVYYFLNGDFFYRLTAMSSMTNFSSHDFNSEGIFSDLAGNLKAVLLRRTMVFIPLLAVLQIVIFRKNRKNRLIVYWFCGLLFLYLFFTMSLAEYKPMPLRFTWYLFPLFLPSMIVASKIFTEIKKIWTVLLLLSYIVLSLFMTDHFRTYFDMENIASFNSYLRSNPEHLIETDHFTKYSIDLIDGFREPARTRRLGKDTEDIITDGAVIVFHPAHISEIRKQGFEYPDDEYFRSAGFVERESFGPIVIFTKE